MRYDIAIIGSGPAGIEAAITAKLRNKSLIIFGNSDSEKIKLSPLIDNYLGLPKIKGITLLEHFNLHLKSLDINVTKENVKTIYALGDYFLINETIEAKTVILALGVSMVKTIKGETSYLGNGVSYCATCDGPLYRNKEVMVIGYNDEAIVEGKYLSEIAKKIYFVPMKKYHDIPNQFEIINDLPLEILESKVKFKNQELNVDGIFILRDFVMLESLVPGLTVDGAHVIVNRDLETNIKGLFACGDITGKPYQIIKAAGEGLVATLNAIKYLDS